MEHLKSHPDCQFRADDQPEPGVSRNSGNFHSINSNEPKPKPRPSEKDKRVK